MSRSTARYLVRFDDICPAMNWPVWERVEQALVHHDVRPIVAVVPDNRDPTLAPGVVRADFWDRVRRWRELGWAIGWHGYQHTYTTNDAGIIGIKHRSEFAGEPEAEQRRRLSAAYEIFRAQGVTPDVWVAPGHSFDWTTVRILQDFGVRYVSDGYFHAPRRWRGSVFVPQQIWRFRPQPSGTWTVCYHTNPWSEAQISRFEADIAAYRASIVSFSDLVGGTWPEVGWRDRGFAVAMRLAIRARQVVAKVRSR